MSFQPGDIVICKSACEINGFTVEKGKRYCVSSVSSGYDGFGSVWVYLEEGYEIIKKYKGHKMLTPGHFHAGRFELCEYSTKAKRFKALIEEVLNE